LLKKSKIYLIYLQREVFTSLFYALFLTFDQKYYIYRYSELFSKYMKRELSKVVCKKCGFITKSNGIAEHIKHTHDMTVDAYISKYGEYRKKYLNYEIRKKQQFECKICKKQCASDRHLSFHVKTHGFTKKEYVLKYIFNGVPPVCECGCGERTKVLGYYPYFRRFKTGHNVYMHIGMARTKETRMRMRKAAIKRIKDKKGVYFYNGVSKEELNLLEFIKNNYNGKILTGDKEILSGLELDIYLPDLHLAIELNGDRFHSDLFKKKSYHLNKTKECTAQHIHLIHIWMFDWIKRKDIIKSILLSKLGGITNKIMARKCVVNEISNKDAQLFLNNNHLQGSSVSNIRLGLFFDGELVQVMTFGKLRIATGLHHKENSYELVRMCSKLNTQITGGANKLFKYFIKNYKSNYIISYANRDWATGNVYEKLNFKFKKFTLPGYFYVKSHIKYHRYKFQKHKLVEQGYDKNKTEYEIMTERGYYRIWNTGNFVYEFKI